MTSETDEDKCNHFQQNYNSPSRGPGVQEGVSWQDREVASACLGGGSQQVRVLSDNVHKESPAEGLLPACAQPRVSLLLSEACTREVRNITQVNFRASCTSKCKSGLSSVSPGELTKEGLLPAFQAAHTASPLSAGSSRKR